VQGADRARTTGVQRRLSKEFTDPEKTAHPMIAGRAIAIAPSLAKTASTKL
jgi:hypothetical protein